jgi:hypothetical protein
VKVTSTISIGLLLAIGWAGCDTANNMEDPNKRSYVRLLGNDGDQHGVDIVVDEDSSMYILGHTTSSAGLGQQLYVVHTDPRGFVIWERTYGGIDDDEARDIEFISDGIGGQNLALLGVVSEMTDPLNANRDFILRRITKDGDLLDSVRGGVPGFSEEAISVSETSNSLFVTGYTNNTPAAGDPSDAMFVRYLKGNGTQPLVLDPNWNHSYGTSPEFELAAKTVEVGNAFYVFGHTNKSEAGATTADAILDYNVFVWVLGPDGIPAKVYLVGDSLIVGSRPGFDETVSSVAVVPTDLGGGYAVSGYSTDPATNTQRMFTMTIRGDLSGVPVEIYTTNKRLLLPEDPRLDDDTRSAPTSSRGASVFVTKNSEFLVLGTEGMNGNENIYLKKLKKLNGDLQDAWIAPSFFSFGGIDNDIPGAVAETPNGGIMVVGTMYLGEPPSGQTKILLMKLSPSGKLGE